MECYLFFRSYSNLWLLYRMLIYFLIEICTPFKYKGIHMKKQDKGKLYKMYKNIQDKKEIKNMQMSLTVQRMFMICFYIGNMLFCKHFPTLNLYFNIKQFPFVLVYFFLRLSNILNANLIDNHEGEKHCKQPNMQCHILSIYVCKSNVFIFKGKKDMSDPHKLTYVPPDHIYWGGSISLQLM